MPRPESSIILPARVSRRQHARLLVALPPLLAALLGSGCGAPPPQTPAQIEPATFTHLEGDVQLPNGAGFEYAALLFADPAVPGSYLGTISIPKQALTGATLTRVRYLPREHVEFEIEASGTPRWIGHYAADGSVACRFLQAERSLPCSMHEVTARVPAR